MKTISTTEESNGLYQFKDFHKFVLKPCITSRSVIYFSNNVTTHTLWHFRLGHPSHSRLKILQNVDSSIVLSSRNCDICHFSK